MMCGSFFLMILILIFFIFFDGYNNIVENIIVHINFL